MDPGDPAQLATLREVTRANRDLMRTVCRQHEEALRQYVGPYYGPETAHQEGRRPINRIEQGLNIYTYLLVGGIPQMEVLAVADALRPLSLGCTITLNAELEQRRVGDVLQRWVRASIMGLGVVQVGWESQGSVRHPLTGELLDVGRWIIDPISVDDLVIDFSAKTLEDGRFMGHRFEMDLEEAQEDPSFDRQARRALRSNTEESFYTDQGTRRTRALSRGHSMWQESLQPRVELQQIHLREEGLLVKFDPDGNGPALSIEEYRGPDPGPYEAIIYNEVEDNPIPLAPVTVWRDMDSLVNALVTKLGDSAVNQKDVLGYEDGSEDDVEDLVSTPHMGTVRMKNPRGVQQFSFNGPSQINLAFTLQCLDWLNNLQGNPDLLAGLGQQAETATQETLMTQAAGARLDAMRDRVTQATARVMKRIAWYYFHDPVRVYRGEKVIAGTSYRVPVRITPEMREGMWEQLNFQLVPYSLKPTPPAERLNQLRGIVQEALQLAPVVGADVRVNLEKYLDLTARYLHLPELTELIEYGEPQAPRGEQPTAGRANSTTRTYVRKSVPSGGTAAGRTASKIQALLGTASEQQRTANQVGAL